MKPKNLNSNNMKFLMLATMILSFCSCSSIPKGVNAVTPFEKEKYLGKWYEIARFDFKFEKGLNNTTAEYSLRDDGKIKVINRGYNYEKKVWKQAIGKAKYAGDGHTAMLKVSFFGPFYGSYVIFELDSENYRYAFVSSYSKSYLWFLSRSPRVKESMKTMFINKIESLGFSSKDLIWVNHK